MRHALASILTLTLALALGGCATVRESAPPQAAAGGNTTVTASTAMPATELLPDLSVIAPDTRYVVIQNSGGSIFLGPILSRINISATTRAMADKYKDSVLSIDPAPIAFEAMNKAGVQTAAGGSFVAKPFVFVQHCYDERFRLSLVLQVEGTGQNAAWVGRYSYHLPTSYTAEKFAALSEGELAAYRAELTQGATALTDLMQRDLAGRLPAKGKTVEFGSLYIIGNKMGGLGIYTMPEELYFRDAQLIEEADGYVTVRMKGDPHQTGIFGGMAFGVHRIERSLVHTLRPPKAS